jgi:putative peptidoglycan lipid II flippase
MIRSVGVVGFFTLLSRFLGLVRDVLMAGCFGTSLPMSAFVVAFTVPNLFRRLFGEGALSAAFIPVFVETKARDGVDAAWTLARRVATLLFLVLAALTVIGVAAAQVGLMWTADGSKAALILSLLRIMLPYMVFICLVALCMAVLNSFRHFAVPAATPLVLNALWIIALWAVVPWVGPGLERKILVVAWAVVLAGGVQLACQVPVLMRYGFRPRIEWDPRDGRVMRVILLMGPAALGLAVAQVNVMIDKLLAAWVGPYAPAALFYSERLVYFPLGILATAMGTVLLPTLSGQVADQQSDRIPATVNQALRNLLFLMIPASVGLGVLAPPIVEMIFQWREFDAESTRYTARALQCYAPGLLVFSLVKVLVPAFYARQDTRTPVRIALWSVGVNLSLNVLFVLTWSPPWKHAGLAFATVLSSLFNAAVLAWILQRDIGSLGWREIASSTGRSTAAAAVMGVTAVAVQRNAMAWAADGGGSVKAGQVGAMAAAIAAAMAVYFLAAWCVRSRELSTFIETLGRRLHRSAG